MAKEPPIRKPDAEAEACYDCPMPGPRLELEYCTYCPKMCRLACPVSTATGQESWTPQAKMQSLNALRKGHVRWTEESALALYACTGCRHCTDYCAHDNEPGKTLLAGRAEAARHGAAPGAVADVVQRMAASHARNMRDMRRAVAAADRTAEGSIALLTPCTSWDDSGADVLALQSLARRLDGGLPVADVEVSCAGYPLWATGQSEAFTRHVAAIADRLAGFARLVVSCSFCLVSLKQWAPAMGVRVRPRVVHVSEYLESRVQAIDAPAHRDTIAYHDPCHLVRYESLVETPRKVLGHLAHVTELPWNREDAECCGAGGLLPRVLPDAARRMAARRFGGLAAGCTTVVTGCSTCKTHLARSAPDGVSVMELGGYVASVLEPR